MSLEDRLISRLVGDPDAIARVQGMGLCAEVFETPLNRLAYDFVIEYWLDSDKTAAPTALVIEAEYPPFKVLTDVEEEAWWLTERLQKRAVTNAFQEIVRGIGDCHTDPIGAVHRLAEDSAKAEKLAGTGADLKFEAEVAKKLHDRKVREEVDRRYAIEQQGPRDRLSWGPVDLTGALDAVLDPEWKPPFPTLFGRTDGVFLIYPGLTHSLHGEPGTGKSLMMQRESVHWINQGQDVLYVDFDSDEVSVVARLIEFGADAEKVRKHFHYLHPEVGTDSPAELAAWIDTLSRPYVLAVVDNVTEAFAAFGYASGDNDDIARWVRAVPKQIAARTGAAVVLIDHVTKDATSRGRWAIGGQAKLAGLTGASYTAEIRAPLGRGLQGEVVVRVGKDRPGSVSPHCGPLRKGDNTQEAARVVFDSTGTSLEIAVYPPATGADRDGDSTTFRPTYLMEQVSRVIEEHPGELTKNQATNRVKGKRHQYVVDAFDLLVSEEIYLEATSERYPRYTSIKPYREKDDPASDKYCDLGDRLRRAGLGTHNSQPEEAVR
jgi:hypothetical protein